MVNTDAAAGAEIPAPGASRVALAFEVADVFLGLGGNVEAGGRDDEGEGPGGAGLALAFEAVADV